MNAPSASAAQSSSVRLRSARAEGWAVPPPSSTNSRATVKCGTFLPVPHAMTIVPRSCPRSPTSPLRAHEPGGREGLALAGSVAPASTPANTCANQCPDRADPPVMRETGICWLPDRVLRICLISARRPRQCGDRNGSLPDADRNESMPPLNAVPQRVEFAPGWRPTLTVGPDRQQADACVACVALRPLPHR